MCPGTMTVSPASMTIASAPTCSASPWSMASIVLPLSRRSPLERSQDRLRPVEVDGHDCLTLRSG